MFKSQALIKQQQIIDTLNQDNASLKDRVYALERDNNGLRAEMDRAKKMKERLHADTAKLRHCKEALGKYQQEKNMLNETKSLLESRYESLLKLFGCFKTTVFRNEEQKKQAAEERELTEMEQDLDRLLDQVEGFHESVLKIRKISNELEMLGVNATIQAAHAGEKGKGFLIVADQMGKLSHHSKKNVEEALHQLTLFTQITRALTHDFTQTVVSIEQNMNTFNELKALINEQLPSITKENIEASDRM